MTALLASGCAQLSLEGKSSSFNKMDNSAVSASSAIRPLTSTIPCDEITMQNVKRSWPAVTLEPARTPGVAALGDSLNGAAGVSADNVSAVYDKVILTEDTNLRGNVLIKGYLVVASQVTLRIEPGTIIRFAATGTRNNAARLVVQGRILAVGTADSPIVMTSDRSKPVRGDWGGISLVSSEKRNLLENCLIEYADSGIEAQFSTINLKTVSVMRSNTGFLMRDTVVQITGGSFSESEIGIEMHDSEFEVRDITVSACKRGVVMSRSAANFSSVKIRDNEQYGLQSEECRIKIASAEISGNGIGARLKGGEGQILATSFHDNRETALHLSGSRMKISRNQFFNNSQDALRLEDGRSLIWGNAFSANKGFNLYNAGREDVGALQNWWGSSDSSVLSQKIYDAVRDPRSGIVHLFPWLNEKPVYLQ